MKLLITSVLAATVATAAAAGNSDRYNDLRFDSAVGHVDSFATAGQATDRPVREITSVTFSTRNTERGTAENGYAYTNPYGVGPNNDSR